MSEETQTEPPAVETQRLSVAFDGTTVLNSINISIHAGESIAVMGASGGGKTTLLKCIAGLQIPDSGDVFVDGVSVTGRPDEVRRKLGLVFQSAALFDYMNVSENVLFGLRRSKSVRRSEEAAAVTDALTRVGLTEADGKKMPSELSGGMRKRVGLARALALKPSIMMYDEPTSGLDPVTAYSIDQLISEVSMRTGSTTIVVSHDVNSVIRISERFLFLADGHVVFDGPTKSLLDPSQPDVLRLVEMANATRLD